MKKIILDKNKIEFLYWKRSLSLAKIAKQLKVSPGKIRKEMVKWSLPRRESKKRDLKLPSKEKIENLYKKNFSLEKIAKRYNTTHGTIRRWMENYNIPRRDNTKYKKSSFSNNSIEKAYLLGLCAGDLHVRRSCKQIIVETTTTHPAMIDLFFKTFKNYGTPIKYPKYNKILKRYQWGVYIHLNKSFEFLLSNPIEIIKNKEEFYSFLAGFFDCEGCIFIYNNQGYIGLSALFYNSNKKILEFINKNLKGKFKTTFEKTFEKNQKTTDGYYRSNNMWIIRMHRMEEIINLLKNMPIKHKEKIDKYNLASKIFSFPNKKWENIQTDVLSIRKEIKSDVEECVSQASIKWKERHNAN